MESKRLRPGAERAKNELRETGRLARRSRALVAWAEWLIRFFLAAVLAGGQVLSEGSPFGLALVGASGAGSGGFAALLGAVSGYLLSLGLEEGLRYAACSILVFSVSFAFFDLAFYQKRAFMPWVTGALNAVTGFVTLVDKPWTAPVAAGFVGELALTVLGVYAFRSAFSLWDREEGEEDREPGPRQRLGLILLGLATLVSLTRLELLGQVSVGRLCAALVSLCAGWTAGPGAGTAVGLAAGLAMDLSDRAPRIYAVSCAMGALVAGFLRGQRRVTAAAGFAVTGAMVVLWSWDSGAGIGAVYEGTLAALVFLLIPQGALDRVGVLFAPESRSGRAQWACQAATRRLRRTAEAFDQVFTALRSAFDPPDRNGEDPSVIYDQAANRVCARCPMRERCWQRDYQDTYDLLNAALPGLLADRQAKAEHFPQRFRDKCCRFSAFSAAVGEELSAHLLRRRYQRQVGRSRRAVCTQYGDMARVLQDTAAAMAAPLRVDSVRTRKLRQFLAGRELDCQGLVTQDPRGHLQLQLEGWDAKALAGETGQQALQSLLDLRLCPAEVEGAQVLFRQREPLSALAGVASRKRRGQSVSGDGCSWFKDEGGRLFLLLCDGMGSGAQAKEDSELCLGLLEKFLRAGVTAPNALKTLDQALSLRGEDTGGFSTVDLLELDLYSGQGTLYKLGASPSYLKQGGTVKCLAGKALPAGLAGQGPDRPDCLEFQMGPGDCLVLLTDGVAPGEDDWLRAALADFDGDSPAALAETLVTYDKEEQDDKTALVIRVGLRQEQENGEKAAV